MYLFIFTLFHFIEVSIVSLLITKIVHTNHHILFYLLVLILNFIYFFFWLPPPLPHIYITEYSVDESMQLTFELNKPIFLLEMDLVSIF